MRIQQGTPANPLTPMFQSQLHNHDPSHGRACRAPNTLIPSLLTLHTTPPLFMHTVPTAGFSWWQWRTVPRGCTLPQESPACLRPGTSDQHAKTAQNQKQTQHTQDQVDHKKTTTQAPDRQAKSAETPASKRQAQAMLKPSNWIEQDYPPSPCEDSGKTPKHAETTPAVVLARGCSRKGGGAGDTVQAHSVSLMRANARQHYRASNCANRRLLSTPTIHLFPGEVAVNGWRSNMYYI